MSTFATCSPAEHLFLSRLDDDDEPKIESLPANAALSFSHGSILLFLSFYFLFCPWTVKRGSPRGGFSSEFHSATMTHNVSDENINTATR